MSGSIGKENMRLTQEHLRAIFGIIPGANMLAYMKVNGLSTKWASRATAEGVKYIVAKADAAKVKDDIIEYMLEPVAATKLAIVQTIAQNALSDMTVTDAMGIALPTKIMATPPAGLDFGWIYELPANQQVRIGMRFRNPCASGDELFAAISYSMGQTQLQTAIYKDWDFFMASEEIVRMDDLANWLVDPPKGGFTLRLRTAGIPVGNLNLCLGRWLKPGTPGNYSWVFRTSNGGPAIMTSAAIAITAGTAPITMNATWAVSATIPAGNYYVTLMAEDNTILTGTYQDAVITM